MGATDLSAPVQLLWVETGSSPEVTLVAANDLQQANQVTRYRRYRMDNRDEKTVTLRLLLKRKFQKLLSSTDVVYVSSLNAIKRCSVLLLKITQTLSGLTTTGPCVVLCSTINWTHTVEQPSPQ